MYEITQKILRITDNKSNLESREGYRLVSHSVAPVVTKRYLGLGGPSRNETTLVYSFLWEKLSP